MIKVYDSNYHNSSSTPYKSSHHMTDTYFDIDIFPFSARVLAPTYLFAYEINHIFLVG